MPYQLLQLGSEVGELQGAWAKAADRVARDRTVPRADKLDEAKRDPQVLKEAGDVGLAYYALCDKLGVDALDLMVKVMESETRSSKI